MSGVPSPSGPQQQQQQQQREQQEQEEEQIPAHTTRFTVCNDEQHAAYHKHHKQQQKWKRRNQYDGDGDRDGSGGPPDRMLHSIMRQMNREGRHDPLRRHVQDVLIVEIEDRIPKLKIDVC